MSEFFDKLEIRDPHEREAELMARLPGLIGRARSAPGWAAHLAAIDEKVVTDREALAGLPVFRKTDLGARQKESAPFGGLNATPVEELARLFLSPGPIFDPEGAGDDWWGSARALFAAGIRKGDILHNSFAYHLTPAGHMFETGARALGCPVIPAGVGNTEMQIAAIAHLKPVAFAGTPDFLKVLLDTATEEGSDASSINKACVSGAALPPSLRDELEARGVSVVQCYGIADLGIVAYESAARDGMIINEDMIIEIVGPGTNDPLPDGEVGEVVVTRFNHDYPMIRFGTGDMSAVLPGPSPCGRTNLRIKGWMGRADQTTKVKGMFIHPGQVAEIGKRHPELGRLRLVVTRQGEQDVLTLMVETETPDKGLAEKLVQTLQSLTKLKGRVELKPAGSLPNDGVVIADERSYD